MRVLISERAIKKKVKQLAALLAREYKGTDCVFVGVLYGGFVFLADLVRELHRHDLHPAIDFIRLTSYQGTESTGTVR
ncbi:MAG: hypoxanthine phosphoribosyltransferase, partial [Thermoproteota archaeon]